MARESSFFFLQQQHQQMQIASARATIRDATTIAMIAARLSTFRHESWHCLVR
jgi:hypothetical protein